MEKRGNLGRERREQRCSATVRRSTRSIPAFTQVLGLLRERDLVAAMDRAPGRMGIGRIRAILNGEELPAMTRSEGERRFLLLIGAAELPAPAVNVRFHGFLVDFLWQASNLVVEVDGHRF